MTAAAWPRSIPVTRVQATLAPATPWQASQWPEVTLRGALGKAVMDLACVRAHEDCARCELADRCVVPAWYDPDRGGGQAVRPLVPSVWLPQDGQVSRERPLKLRLDLLGPVPLPELVLAALAHATASGLGPDRVPHAITRVSLVGQQSVDGGAELLTQPERWPVPAGLGALMRPLPAHPTGVVLRLRTPTRGKRVSAHRPPHPAEILRLALLRLRAVERSLGLVLLRDWPDPSQVRGRWREARFHQRQRYSSRQGQPVDLSGWTGTLELGESVAPFADLLAAAEVLHIGRGTSAGGGRVTAAWEDGGNTPGDPPADHGSSSRNTA